MFKARQRFVAIAVAFACGPGALGAVSLTLTDAGAPPTSNLRAGDVLRLHLNLGITNYTEVFGYTFFLGTNQPGAFRITGRTNNGLISDLTTPNTMVTLPDFNLLNPLNGKDLGATGTLGGPDWPWEYFWAMGEPAMQTITLTAQQDLGAFQIFLANASWNGLDGTQYPFDALGGYAWPEPCTALLLMAGMVVLVRKRKGGQTSHGRPVRVGSRPAGGQVNS
jgi:hypothetical protein